MDPGPIAGPRPGPSPGDSSPNREAENEKSPDLRQASGPASGTQRASTDAGPGPVPPAKLERTSPTDPAFWSRVIEASGASRRVRVLLEGSRCEKVAAGFGGAVVSVRVGIEVLAPAKALLAEIEGVAGGVAGSAVKVELVSDAPVVQAPVAKANMTEHPLVKSAMELFGARLVSVQGRPPAQG